MLSQNYPKWQDLLPELSLAIVERLTSIGDFISFRGVCRSWRSAATFDNFDTELPQLPCLMYLAEKGEIGEKGEGKLILDENEKGEGKSILDENEKGEGESILDEKEVVEIWDNGEGNPILNEKEVKIWDVDTNTCMITNFPPIYCRDPPLSCFGWILCDSRESAAVSLRHFLLPINIKLPHMHLVSKMVLSCSPMKSDCVVMVVWGMDDGLAFCRPGDESWTEIDEGVRPFFNFFDIIYHNRKLYVVHFGGTMIYECNIHGSNPKKLVQVFAFDDIMSELVNKQSYLVELREKFLIVSRYNERYSGTVVKFRVFEVDLEDGSAEEIGDLGDSSIFLGTNSSIYVEIPESESYPWRLSLDVFTSHILIRCGRIQMRVSID